MATNIRKSKSELSSREKIGISQDDYIVFLKVSKSLLAMHEIQQRLLPTNALIKDSMIEVCINKTGVPVAVTQAVAQQQHKNKALLQKRQEYCLLVAEKTKRQLAKMRLQYQKCMNMIKVAALLPQVLLTALPTNKDQQSDTEWLEIYAGIAQYKAEQCGIGIQTLLQLKINALLNEAESISELLGKEEL